MFYDDGFSQWYESMVYGVNINVFIRQLVISFLIVIIIIPSPIVHAQELCYTNAVISLLMFIKMGHQGGQFQQLI